MKKRPVSTASDHPPLPARRLAQAALGLEEVAGSSGYRAGSHLMLALGISLIAHALLLSIHFAFPEASRQFRDKALEVILVNSRSSPSPSPAQALAQTHLDGGGTTEEDRRLKSPLPLKERDQDGDRLEAARQRVRELEAMQQKLLTQAKKAAPAIDKSPPKTDTTPPAPVPPVVSGRDLAQSALALARAEAEIAQQVEDYNKRPRKKNIGVRAEEYRFAQYVENWRQKVERVGTLNYPEEARGKLYGNLILSVSIRSDGQVEKIEINRSSGHKVLDNAARRIIEMAGPYPAFPPDIRRDTDVIEITRAWFFTRGDKVESR